MTLQAKETIFLNIQDISFSIIIGIEKKRKEKKYKTVCLKCRISKKICNAVQRNKIKRRLRCIIRFDYQKFIAY